MAMSEAALEARRAYKREWRKRNPDKIKAYEERHWQKVAEARAAAEGQQQPEDDADEQKKAV